MDDEDPYRASHQSGTCPRCQNSTEGDGALERLVCVAGCGEWYPKERLARVWGAIEKQPTKDPSGWPWGAAMCPICRSEMKIAYREELRFDYCTNHGVWLDTGEIERFAQLFGVS